MRHAQHDIEVALRYVRDTELRIVEQRARIARLQEERQPTDFAEDLLRALRECCDLVKAHLGSMTDPSNPTISHNEAGAAQGALVSLIWHQILRHSGFRAANQNSAGAVACQPSRVMPAACSVWG
jgi:hypothetical protein